MSFNATAVISKTASYTALVTDHQINVTPAAATTITLPAISSLAAAMYGGKKTFYIQNVDGAYAVTITADTTKPDYLASRDRVHDAGPVLRTYTSIVLTGATDYVIIESDPIANYWWIREMGLSTSYHGATFGTPKEFNLTCTGTAAMNAMDIRINDITTGSNSTNGVCIYKYSGGAHTDGYGAALNVDHVLGAAQVTMSHGISVNISTANSATLTGTYVVGIAVDMAADIAGKGCALLWLNKNNTTAGVNHDCYIYCAAQGSVVQTGSALIHLHGARHPQYFVELSHLYETGFFTKTTLSGSIVARLAIHIGSTTYYIPLYTS